MYDSLTTLRAALKRLEERREEEPGDVMRPVTGSAIHSRTVREMVGGIDRIKSTKAESC